MAGSHLNSLVGGANNGFVFFSVSREKSFEVKQTMFFHARAEIIIKSKLGDTQCSILNCLEKNYFYIKII
jgi:hypothetical protein